MAMNMSTDMECRLIAKHNVPQKSFIIVHLMKHICSKRESIGLLRSSWCCVITCVRTPLHIILRKLGEFSFYLVKISHLYLVLLLPCDRSKVHHDLRDTLYIAGLQGVRKIGAQKPCSASKRELEACRLERC